MDICAVVTLPMAGLRMNGSERHEPQRRPAGVGGGRSEVVELHLCPECGSGLVQPFDWMQTDESHWRVSLRCPECEWRSVGLFEQAVLDRFDQVLDAGTDALHADLRELERVNMEAELQRFHSALGEDLILPEDF